MRLPEEEALNEQVNSRRIEEVDDCFEARDQILLSIAISLKRIADTMLTFERGRGAA